MPKAETGKPPEITAPADSAAGLPAVAEVLRQLHAKTGVVRGASALLRMNQPDGFDCPGCAWPEDTEHRKQFEFCENGAKAFADEATRDRITPDFFATHSLADLETKSGRWLNEQGRLTQPMVRKPGATHYTPITWFSAYEMIARELNALESPDEAAFYTSGRTSNEAAYLWQLFARVYGTNNMPDCSNMCHESSGTALSEVIGSGKGTVRLSDFDAAGAIFLFGQNPGSNHPRMLATLERAKRNGAKIVTVNPLNEAGSQRFRNPQTVSGLLGNGTELCDLHLPVRVNGDGALIKGLSKALLEAESADPGSVLDRGFIDSHTTRFEAFAAHIAALDWGTIERQSGVSESMIRAAAEIVATADGTICCWAMGLTQHRDAVANIQEVINFLMLRGNLGRPGAGACPVRGHSNVQGDRTMGVWEKPDGAFLERLATEFGFAPPSHHGFDTLTSLHAMAAGKLKVFIALGGNFAAATPDSAFTENAIRKCRLTVQISTKLNRSHVVCGESALILPVLGRSELDRQPAGVQFVTNENSMGVVTPSRGKLAPASPHLKSEVRVVAELADATVGPRSEVHWLEFANDYEKVRASIARTIPGFERFEDRIYDDGFIELPHAVRDERRFATAQGRAVFTCHPLADSDMPAGTWLLTTIRSHDQFNTTVYADDDRYRGIYGGRDVVFMNPADLHAAGLKPGERVEVRSASEGPERVLRGFRVVPYELPAGCLAMYYPEANPLVPVGAFASGSNTPAYKSIPVTLVPAG